ncbi:hypothetical protein PLICRDRAFT_97830 [Plicaturopsis crispa FD-325 SS-3]|nr:hypothetical protein PLICRDRAFT_97830 [Plicaturopsis crispa FD-325 SS-3]
MTAPAYEFDAADADLVLVARGEGAENGTEFRVHKCILGAASPFFADMFSLPQPQGTAKSPPEREGDLPTVSVSETAATLGKLLQFAYPIADPAIETLDELSEILGAAVKYDFGAVLSTMRRLLITPPFVSTAPTRVYAIACRYEFEAEARIASRHTLEVSVLDCPLSDDPKHITAYDYHRLLDLHRTRTRAAQALLVPSDDVKCMQCNGSYYGGVLTPPQWWGEFERRAREELARRPTSGVIFELDFLAGVAHATGCPRCAASMLDSHKFLGELKRNIDALPSTI